MSRSEHIAKIKRNLAELRSRMQRVYGEADSALRDIALLDQELIQLERDGGAS